MLPIFKQCFSIFAGRHHHLWRWDWLRLRGWWWQWGRLWEWGGTTGGSSGGGGGTGGSPLLTVDGGTGGCSWSDGVTRGLLREWLLLYKSHSGALVPVNVALFSDSTPLFPLLRPIFPTLKKFGLTATTGPGWLLVT